MRIIQVFKILLIASCLYGVEIHALTAQDNSGLREQYAAQFRAPTESDRSKLRNQAALSLQRLEAQLMKIEPAKRARIRELFNLDQLRELLQSDSVSLPQLRAIERKFYGRYQGVEPRWFVPFRQALTAYINFLVVADHADLRSEFEKRLRILDEALASTQVPDSLQIARQVDWLIAAGQVPELVARLQQQFNHPCIVVDVDLKYIMPYLEDYQREISQSEFTTNRIVGVPVSGVSYFKANVLPTLTRNPDRATVRLQIDGTIDSPSNDSRPAPQRAPLIGTVSVALKTKGVTEVHGYKDIYWNGSSLEAEPARIQCQTNAELDKVAISRNYRFPKRKIAMRVDKKIRQRTHEEVQKKSPAANRESADIAQRSVAAQLDSEVERLLDQANEKIGQFYRDPLLSLGFFPTGSSRSGVDAIRLSFRGQNYGGIGAPQALPTVQLKGDLEVALHETVCTGILAGYLRGRKVRDIEFKNIHRELRGFVPNALRISGNQSWSVWLSSEAPLEARFRKDRVVMALNMESLVIEDRTHSHPFQVSASYRVVPDFDVPRFERDGDVTFAWLTGNPRDAQVEAKLRRFITAKFDAFFAREMHLDGLSAPSGKQWGAVSTMSIIESNLQNGWWRVVFKGRNLNRLK